MLHTAWGELLKVCVTGGCGEVSNNSFNKGLMHSWTINLGTDAKGWDVPAHILMYRRAH